MEFKIRETSFKNMFDNILSINYTEVNFPDPERDRDEWEWKFKHGLADKIVTSRDEDNKED